MVMADTSILAGYMGILSLDGELIRVNTFNVNPEQTPLYYDHTVGLRDSIPTSIKATKGDTGFKDTPQKNLWRPSVIGITGSMAFPVQEGSEQSIFEKAKTGDDFDMSYSRDCENAVDYSSCKVSQYQLSMTAGDVPNVSISVMAIDAVEAAANGPWTDTKRLITWDTCSVTVPELNTDTPILSFNMSINNECKYVYTAGVNNDKKLRPALIRVGLQSVTGTITFYSKGIDLTFMDDTTTEKVIQVNMNGFSFGVNCVYVPIKRDGQVGPIISTLGFQGVGSFWV